MNVTAPGKRVLGRVAAAALASGALGLAGLGLGAGIAQAGYCPSDPPDWAPGGPPNSSFVHWDWNVCHDYHYGPTGVVDDDTGFVWLYPDGPIAPAGPPAPPGQIAPGCPPWATIFSGPAQCGGL
jgi:hypothetical protein